MMLSKGNIKPDFWRVIDTHYEKECYTDVLKDACLYIIQLVQERSDQEHLDGEKLITNVFSEQNPKLLINNNENVSEKDEQRGFGFLLRGIICAIRNPISHNKDFVFDKDEADAILLFINNYILPKLDNSKDFNYVEDWFAFIFCENNNDSKKFSDTVLNNMSKKEKYNLLINIINKLDNIKEGKYKYIINKLYDDLRKNEKNEVINMINKKLIKAGDNRYLRMFFDHFNVEIWKELDELVKIRIEEMIYNDIYKGKVYIDPDTMSENCIGTLGTWTQNWISNFTNNIEITNLIFQKMKNDSEADYVLEYFYSVLTDRDNLKKYKNMIIEGLKNGNIKYKKLMDNIFLFDDGQDEILNQFREYYVNFKENEADDLPF